MSVPEIFRFAAAFTSIVTIRQCHVSVWVRTSSTLHGVDTFDAVLGFDIVDIRLSAVRNLHEGFCSTT